ncbi:ribonuclease P protein component [Candidatus Kaiserbacteria bacterium]|nr:ribonuclease P protein component [Candidatus Kaiserbacteria bacterium]
MTDKTRLSRTDFATLRTGRRLHGALFSLSVSPLPRARRTSFACIVSKAVAGKATHRNLIKRRCREAVRARLRAFSTRTPLALVFRAKKPAAAAAFSAFKRDIDTLIGNSL